MKKTCIVLICVLLLVQLFSLNAFGDDVEKTTLIVDYHSGDVVFDGVEIAIYHVANIAEDGSYELCGAFTDYPINVKVVRTQEEWRSIATTVGGYIVGDNVSPSYVQTTNDEGKALFSDIPKGLYLVSGFQVEKNELIYEFESFFATLPRPDENGVPQYEVTAIPKFETRIPEPDDLEYKVIKLWKDDGYDKRPTTVEVEIFKGSELVYTQTLSSDNNWSFTWTAKDDGSKWTVVERDIPEGYTVTVTDNETAFVVTNTYEIQTPPPATGDVPVVWPYVLAMFSVGCILLLLSVGIKKVKNV